jgi:hypothetical protein
MGRPSGRNQTRSGAALEELWLAQRGRRGAQRYQATSESGHHLAVRIGGPGQPGGFVVEPVGIVVAALGAPALVAGQQHRGAGGQHQSGQQVARLAPAQTAHCRIAGFALDTAVPGTVVIGAVGAVLTVGLVVFAVVRDQIPQREPVVSGDEVDRCPRPPPVRRVEI